MRLLIYVALALPVVVENPAFAQSSAQPGKPELSAPSGGQSARRSGGAAADDEQARFKECMDHWDAKTHMTKQEWRRTCQRVIDERIKYLREHGYTSEMKRKKSPN
jgi:hypothetical protein